MAPGTLGLREQALVASGSVSLVMALAALLRFLFSCRVPTFVTSALLALRREFFQKDASKNEVERLMHEKLLIQKAQQLKMACRFACFGMAPLVANLMVQSLAAGPTGFTQSQEIVLIVIHAVMTTVAVWPNIMTPRTLDSFYVILMLLLSLAVFPFHYDDGMVVQMLFLANAGFLLLTSVRRSSGRSIPLSFIVNTGYAVSSGGSLYLRGASCCLSPMSCAVIQVMVVFIAASIAHVVEVGFRDLMVQSLQTQETKEQYSAAFALLRSVCDVVVELNCEGYIASGGPDLCAMLQVSEESLDEPGPASADFQFSRLLSAEDQAEFVRRLMDPEKALQTGLAQSMHTRIKDGVGNELSLQLLWFQFTRLDGQRYFMIGIREFSDGIARPSRTSQDQDDERQSPGYQAVRIDGFLSEFPSTTSSSTSVDDVALAVAVVDCTKTGYPVQGLTAKFIALVGTLPLHVPLLQAVANREAFQAWMEYSLRALKNMLPPLSDQWVQITTPGGNKRSALCQFVIGSEHDQATDAQLDMERVCLYFYGIRQSSQEFTDEGRVAL